MLHLEYKYVQSKEWFHLRLQERLVHISSHCKNNSKVAQYLYKMNHMLWAILHQIKKHFKTSFVTKLWC